MSVITNKWNDGSGDSINIESPSFQGNQTVKISSPVQKGTSKRSMKFIGKCKKDSSKQAVSYTHLKRKKADKIKNETGSELEAIVLKRIKELDETELYKYVTFVNIPDYIRWRYCLLSSKVANKVEDINKSVNIQFYLTSDSERKALKRCV